MPNKSLQPQTFSIDGHPNALAWCPDGAQLAVTDAEGRIHLRGEGTGAAVPLGALFAGAIAACGEAAFLVATDRGALRVVRGQAARVGPEPPGPVEAVATDLTGGEAFAAGREVHWRHPTGSHLLSGHPSTVAGIAFSPQGNALAASHYGGVTVWLVRAGDAPRRASLEYAGSHLAIAWSPDGLHVATATQDKEVHVWRVAEGTDMRMSGYEAKVRHLSWSRDSRWLVTSGADSAIAWDFSAPGPQGRPPRMIGPYTERLVTAVACDPHGNRVAIGCGDGAVWVAAFEGTGDGARWWRDGGAQVTALAWSPVGGRLAATRADGSVAVLAPPALRER